MSFASPLLQDIRVSLRLLAKSPGATALSVISIAFGIGFTTALFGVADALYFRPFPFRHAEQVLQVESLGDDGQAILYGWPDCEDMARAAKGVADVAAYERIGALLAGPEENRHVLLYPVTSNYFSFLGVPAAVGRASVDPVDGQATAVLGERLWRSRFAGDPAVVGKTIRLNGKPFTVAGVMPADFTGNVRGVPNGVWIGIEQYFSLLGSPAERTDRNWQFEMMVRLKPGVAREQAAARLDAAIRGPGKHKAAPKGATGTWLDQAYALTRRQQLTGAAALLLLLGVILFIGCANAAQLRMAQAEARKIELSIRRALGAGSWSVTRLLLTDSALVCLAGAALGLLLAKWLLDLLNAGVSTAMSFMDLAARLDARVLLVALAAAVASVLLAGLTPVRLAVRRDIGEVLKTGQRAGAAITEWRRKALVGVQIAATVLFFGMAVQCIENVRNAARLRPAFDPGKKMLLIGAGLQPGAGSPEQAREHLSAIPGVRAATFARRIHLSGSGDGMTARVEIPGRQPAGVKLNQVAGNYFAVMGTRVLAGRGIEPADRDGSTPVVVVSRLFADHLLGGGDPIGQWISIDGKKRQIVGISEDGPVGEPTLHEELAPYLYLPYAQAASGDLVFMVETQTDPAALARKVRGELMRFDPKMAVFSATTLRRHMDTALFFDRAAAVMATAMGAVGFLLTAAGLFGVVQFAIERRRRDLGMRIALGAEPADLLRMVLGEALRICAWGMPAGLLLLAVSARAAQSMLIGVTALDPLTYVLSAAAAVAIALAAAWLPAVRAGLVDPMEALRAE